ncbi:MAG TPA: flagellar basal body rod protein FlgB [Burkholderiaceae bacterium]|jgi:flagellar basal-body rod protein FlgB|nr:flagellar basal body rod protein FlgB [Burkholderiaceae bacterium]
MPSTPIDRMTATLDFQAAALSLQAQRAKVLASNIANADTPNYRAKDFDFGQALTQATQATTQTQSAAAVARTHPAHLSAAGTVAPAPVLQYRQPLQAALDGNTVDLDTERAAFAESSVRYEATLRFLNGQIKTMLTAINGQ